MFLTTRNNLDRIHILRRVALVKREKEARNFHWWSWFLGIINEPHSLPTDYYERC